MWLSLLLSVGAEASGTSGRKAGLRELAQRLGVTQTRVRPGLYGRVEAWLASHPEAPENARRVLKEPRVGILLEALLKHVGAPSIDADVYFPGRASQEGLPLLRRWDEDSKTLVRGFVEAGPATIPTKLDATVGWWLEQIYQLDASVEGWTLWQAMDQAGLLREGAPERVQDWIEMTHPDLGRYTWATAKDASDAWHKAMTGTAGYGQPIVGGDVRVLATWPDGARIVQLVSRRDFADEGTSMGHCVGGPHDQDEPAPGNGHYWQGSRDGRFALISYRDPQGRPLCTVNLERNAEGRIQVEQIQGPGDALVPLFAIGRVLVWLVPFLRRAGAGIDEVEMAVGLAFRTPPDALFVSEEKRAGLLSLPDPFGLRDVLETFEIKSRAKDPLVLWVVELARAVRRSFAETAYPQALSVQREEDIARELRFMLKKNQDDRGNVALFSFGPHLEVLDGEEESILTPWVLVADLEVYSEDENPPSVSIAWSAYQRDEQMDDLKDLDDLFEVDLNPFPFLEEKGLLFTVDGLLAWLFARLEDKDAELQAVTVVAPPLLGTTPIGPMPGG